jgi:predicted nicotinamide N-methyase
MSNEREECAPTSNTSGSQEEQTTVTEQQQQQPQPQTPSSSLTSVVETTEGTSKKPTPFFHVGEVPIYYHDRWDVSASSIGGGLWSTGTAMAHFFAQHPFLEICGLNNELLLALAANHQSSRDDRGDCHGDVDRSNDNDVRLRALELGSGNGFLSACLLASLQNANDQKRTENKNIDNITEIDDGVIDAYAKANNKATRQQQSRIFQTLVVTDLDDHIPYMEETLFKANAHILETARGDLGIDVSVASHKWGEFDTNDDVDNENEKEVAPGGSTDTTDPSSADTSTNHPLLQPHSFDFIFGSDLAYRKELYEPLVSSLVTLSHPRTIILIGCTMQDTRPAFFDLLWQHGFTYTRIPDGYMMPEYKGKIFGLFLIQKRR